MRDSHAQNLNACGLCRSLVHPKLAIGQQVSGTVETSNDGHQFLKWKHGLRDDYLYVPLNSIDGQLHLLKDTHPTIISTLVLIDRTVDPVAPMLTQATLPATLNFHLPA